MAAIVGIVVTSTIACRVHASGTEQEPALYWVLGLGGITPAWAVAFLSVLGPRVEVVGRPRAFFMTAIGVGLLGVIATDVVVRRLRASGASASALAFWLLGVAALLPAWLLTLLGRAWIAR